MIKTKLFTITLLLLGACTNAPKMTHSLLFAMDATNSLSSVARPQNMEGIRNIVTKTLGLDPKIVNYDGSEIYTSLFGEDLRPKISKAKMDVGESYFYQNDKDRLKENLQYDEKIKADFDELDVSIREDSRSNILEGLSYLLNQFSLRLDTSSKFKTAIFYTDGIQQSSTVSFSRLYREGKLKSSYAKLSDDYNETNPLKLSKGIRIYLVNYSNEELQNQRLIDASLGFLKFHFERAGSEVHILSSL